MSLKRITLRDFVIVTLLELELDAGFTVLTGETGAGKSILIDALQLAFIYRRGSSRATDRLARKIADSSREFSLENGNRTFSRSAGSDPQRSVSENSEQLRGDRLEASSRSKKVLDKTADSSQSLGHDLPSTGRT